jgi:hypothetical protein
LEDHRVAKPDATGRECFIASDMPSEADCLFAFGPGSTRFAISWQDTDHVRVVDPHSGEEVKRCTGFHRVTGVAFLSADELLVAAYGGCYRCNLARGKRKLLSKEGWQASITVSPSCGLVAIGVTGGIDLYDVRKSQVSHRLGTGFAFLHWGNRSGFSRGERYIAAELKPSLVGVWDVHTGRRQRVFDTEAHAFAFRDDTLTLALEDADGHIRIYEPDEGEAPAKQLNIERPWTYIGARALQFRNKGRTLALLLSDGNFIRLDTATGKVLRHYPPPGARTVRGAVSSADWASFAGATDGGVVIWPGR